MQTPHCEPVLSQKHHEGPRDDPRFHECGAERAEGEQRKRKRLTMEQVERLEQVFAAERNPSMKTRMAVAASIGLSLRCVQVWFQNKRAKSKTQPMPASAKMKALEKRTEVCRLTPGQHDAMLQESFYRLQIALQRDTLKPPTLTPQPSIVLEEGKLDAAQANFELDMLLMDNPHGLFSIDGRS